MKTKIIYISGSEVFEMADIRAAFDEVRGTLGLGTDTILFGVPVDSDDAMANKNAAAGKIIDVTEPHTEIQPTIPDEIPGNNDVYQEKQETPTEPDNIVPQSPALVKKSRGRPRKSAIMAESKIPTPSETIPTDETPNTPAEQTAEKIIPILSVLASKSNDTIVADDTDATPGDANLDETVDEITEPVAQPTAAPDMAAIDPNAIDDVATQPTDADENMSIEDMIADDAPTAPVEKTLEQLLESMAPLREDHGDVSAAAPGAPEPLEITPGDIPAIDDADATLEQLAAEFADTADEIPTAPATPSQGKIGKLKNILPFKKARREDTGLMGDLFGWAGVAANDEDFSIPGFFTTAASKK